jgi:hypothetical protein
MRAPVLHVFLAACGLAAAVPAQADDNWDCGGTKIIEIGMSQDEVLENCGPPTSKKVEEQAQRDGKHYVGTVPFERWTYSSYSSTRVLTFDEGKLISIETPETP